jgi:hypothetical protein
MPPYQNESLHDMHALMQQLDDLNAAHAVDHLGTKKKPVVLPESETQPAAPPPKTKQTGGIAGTFSRGAARAQEAMFGKPLSAAEIQQSFCEIAALSGNWTDDVVKDMQKMLQNNKSTKKYCPTDNRWNVPTKL